MSACLFTARSRALAPLLQPRRRRAACHGGLVTEAVYRIEHETRYVHAGGVSTSQHVAYLTPRTLPHQRPRWHELAIEPAPASRVQRIDCFGNVVDQFTILTPYDELGVIARSVVAVNAIERALAADAGGPWEVVRDGLVYERGAPYADAAEYSYPSPYAVTAPELAAFAKASFVARRPLVEAAVHLMHRIHEEFAFDPGSTTIATPVTRVLADRRGVCQDFAHLQIGCLRSLGLAARYVSGYLLTEPPPGQPQARRRRRVPCMAVGLVSALGLGGSRSDQRRPAVAAPRHAGLGTRLWRCEPAARRGDRRPRSHAACRRQRNADRRSRCHDDPSGFNERVS